LDLVSFAKKCWADYQPHAQEGFMTLAFIVIPPAVLVAVLSFIPVIGALLGFGLALLLLPLEMLAMMFVGVGAYSEFSLRLAVGRPINHRQALHIQLGRMFPFFLAILIPSLVMSVGLMLCLIPGILLGFWIYPVYMVEGKKALDNNMRSFELLKADWGLAGRYAIIAFAASFIAQVPGWIVATLPVIGALSGVVSAACVAAVLPFVGYVQYRVYFDLRRKVDGEAALQHDLATNSVLAKG
jgi:hypothetical protein